MSPPLTKRHCHPTPCLQTPSSGYAFQTKTAAEVNAWAAAEMVSFLEPAAQVGCVSRQQGTSSRQPVPT